MELLGKIGKFVVVGCIIAAVDLASIYFSAISDNPALFKFKVIPNLKD